MSTRELAGGPAGGGPAARPVPLLTDDDELLDEAEKHLEALNFLLQQPTASRLAAARDKAFLADAVLSDVVDTSDPRWWPLVMQVQESLRSVGAHCRRPDVRLELLSKLNPGPAAHNEDTLWVFVGTEIDSLGNVALHAFAPSRAWPWRAGRQAFTGPGNTHCLWGPHWLLPAITQVQWLDVQHPKSFAIGAAEVEVATTIWEPHNPDSAYRDVHVALNAARALLTA